MRLTSKMMKFSQRRLLRRLMLQPNGDTILKRVDELLQG